MENFLSSFPNGCKPFGQHQGDRPDALDKGSASPSPPSDIKLRSVLFFCRPLSRCVELVTCVFPIDPSALRPLLRMTAFVPRATRLNLKRTRPRDQKKRRALGKRMALRDESTRSRKGVVKFMMHVL